jgi:hypothetical protein
MKENMVNDNPKIALCLSGLIRSSFFCFPYIYNSFLNNQYDLDVFIHTWNNSPIIDLYKPKKIEIENQKQVLDYLIPQIKLNSNVKIEGNIINNISMYHSIKRCSDLVDNSYDIIIRCRFDLLLQEKINLKVILNDILSKNYDIYIPNIEFNMGGYNDQLAVGSYNSMKIYSDCIFSISKIANQTGRWHPETFLKKYLDEFNMTIYQDDYDYRLVRRVNPVLNWPENPYNYLNV